MKEQPLSNKTFLWEYRRKPGMEIKFVEGKCRVIHPVLVNTFTLGIVKVFSCISWVVIFLEMIAVCLRASSKVLRTHHGTHAVKNV